MKTKIKHSIRNVAILAFVFIFLTMAKFLNTVPTNTLRWIGGFALVSLCGWIIYKLKHKSEKYINERGYVVLSSENELEHRFIAKQLLKRDLYPNEIVHHINGNKTDNLVRNLCLMDNEKHEHFHSWLSWKKSKSGSYPRFRDQKRVLVEEYGGILLESISIENTLDESKSLDTSSQSHHDCTSEISDEHDLHCSKVLFDELRSLRKKLANERKVPAYMVFDDRTLTQMVESLPDTDELLLQIKGVGPAKIQMYGAQFISVLKRYKAENKITSKSKIDSA